MAGRARPTFLKRQKEQKRAQKAVEKRAAQQARRDRRAAGIEDEPEFENRLLGPDDVGAAIDFAMPSDDAPKDSDD